MANNMWWETLNLKLGLHPSLRWSSWCPCAANGSPLPRLEGRHFCKYSNGMHGSNIMTALRWKQIHQNLQVAWPTISKLKSTTAYIACLIVHFLILLQLLNIYSRSQLVLKHASNGCRTSCNFFSSAEAIYKSRLPEVNSSYLKMDEHGGHSIRSAWWKALKFKLFRTLHSHWPYVEFFRLVQQICRIL